MQKIEDSPQDGYLFRLAAAEDAEAIFRVMQEVYEQMENKELFVTSDLEYIKAHIAAEGFMVIADSPSGEMAGNFMVRYPMGAEDNLGRDLGLPPEELLKVAHMESAVVLPSHRGNHLQARMLRYAEGLIDKERFIYFMATVSPDNPASFKSLERSGYRLVAVRQKYEGLLRRIYCKKI